MSALPLITALAQCILPCRIAPAIHHAANLSVRSDTRIIAPPEYGPRQGVEITDPMQAPSVAHRLTGLQDVFEVAHAAPITGVYFLCFAVCRAKTRPRKRCASSAGSSDRRASLPARLMQSKRRR